MAVIGGFGGELFVNNTGFLMPTIDVLNEEEFV